MADADEQPQVRLAAAVHDGHLLAIHVIAERAEHERERELLGAALHEQRSAREEQLAALRVDLAERAEALLRAQRLRLDDARARARAVLDQRQLLQAPHVQERRLVRGVDDLVAALRERPQEPVEVALSLRSQEQLGLLDQQYEPPLARLAHRLHAAHQRSCACRR